MRLGNLCGLLVGALVLIGLPAAASAQTEPGILNRLEVQRFAASTTPADHSKLAAHFAALADRYTAIARRHTTMANAPSGNPNRDTGWYGRQAHFTRLAEQNSQWAATARELAAHHERLAAGIQSAPPPNAIVFEAGEGAPEPNAEDLARLAAEARTPADHRLLEIAYRARADQYTAEANKHSTMASAYRGTKIAQAADHCDRIVKLARKAAAEAMAAALLHQQLAGAL